MLSSQPYDRVEACGRLPCVLAFGAARGCSFVFWHLLTALRNMSRCGGCWMAHCVDVRLPQRFCTRSNGCMPGTSGHTAVLKCLLQCFPQHLYKIP